MKKVFLTMMLIGAFVSVASAGTPKYCVGLELDGQEVIHISYDARPFEKGETFEALRQGKMEKKYLDSFNSNERFGKLAVLETKKDLVLGDLKVPAGKYDAGFNADEKGDFFFVVWFGEEAHKTKIQIDEHKTKALPNLCLLLGPHEGNSALIALYGPVYAVLGVKVDGAAATSDAGAAATTEQPKAEQKVEEKKTEEAKAEGDQEEDEDEDGWDSLETHSFSGR